MATRSFFRTVRITILVLLLFFVAMNSWLTRMRTTDWVEPLWVAVYPVNGDGSAATQTYIDNLSRDDFESIASFLSSEAARYRVGIRDPLSIQLAPQVFEHPPTPPENGQTLAVMLWSLRLRYWSWRNDTYDGPKPDVQMFVVYHDPENHRRLRHSLGIQKGLVGVVNAFASKQYQQRNNVIVAHEFLHTVGASDKYDPSTNQPLYPHGYAEPERSPLYPQRNAEIMAGRIPLSEDQAIMPESVAYSSIGPQTAREIRWIR
jgi:hypothetical protein